MRTVAIWLTGLSVSCILGHFVVKLFLNWLSDQLDLPRDRNPNPNEPSVQTNPVITGVFERIFFTIVVAADIPAYLPSMMAWLGLKLAANWQSREIAKDRDRTNYKFSALLAGFLSMLISLSAGLVMRRLLTHGK